jgi:DNA-binding NarL/FixJ family response regulator
MTKQKLLSKLLLVVEDNENTRIQLANVLALYFENIIFAVDGCDGVEKIKDNKPDIIVSDIKMPCLGGLEMIKEIKNDFYKPIVIMTTAFSDEEYLLDALDIKVDAYLIKPINIETLVSKIKENLNLYEVHDLRYKKLSAREYEVFIDLAKGLKSSEIAAKYEIKSKTISTYRNRIFEKMSFKSNADLVTYVIKNNLI